MSDDEDPGPRFTTARVARAYVLEVCASMLDSQLNHYPENVEGWMFGGVDHPEDRERVTAEIRRLQDSLLKRAAKLRGER